MNFELLKPDTDALSKTDWKKPRVDIKDRIGLVGLAASAFMIVLVFHPWFGFSKDAESVTLPGITLWYGIIGFLTAAATLACNIYRHKALAFWTATASIFFGIIGMFKYADITFKGMPIPAELIKISVSLGDGETTRWGAILYFITSLVAAACAFIKAMDIKIPKLQE